jgi:hypothetical protein
MLINGKYVEVDKILQLRDSARVVLENKAFKLIREQVVFTAVALGVHTVETERQMLFARAAIWFGQQEEKFLQALAQRNG